MFYVFTTVTRDRDSHLLRVDRPESCQICACYRMAGYVGSDHGRAARWRIVLEDGGRAMM